MRLFAGILGLILLFTTLWDAFETIILPRRVTRRYRLVRLFYRVTWGIWAGIYRMLRSQKLRDRQLSYFGPLSLLMAFRSRGPLPRSWPSPCSTLPPVQPSLSLREDLRRTEPIFT